MNYKDFIKKILSDKLRGIYLIDSEEEYLKESIIDISKDTINFKDFNYIEMKGKISLEELQTAMDTYPIMEDKKLIIWRNIDFSQKNIKEYEDINNSLIKQMDSLGDYLIFLIIPESKVYKGKLYKNLKKEEKIVQIDRLNNDQLLSFIGKKFVKSGKKIKKSYINEIINRFSYLNKNSNIDLYEIVNTVDKIIANSDKKEVSFEDVSDQLDQVLDLNIFNLTDALSIRDTKKAMNTYMYMAKDLDEIYKIYHMIVRHIRNLIGIKVLSKDFFNDSYIMKAMSLSSYELKKDKVFINNFSLDKLMEIQDFLYNMEKNQKSQDFDFDLNMLMLISKFSRN